MSFITNIILTVATDLRIWDIQGGVLKRGEAMLKIDRQIITDTKARGGKKEVKPICPIMMMFSHAVIFSIMHNLLKSTKKGETRVVHIDRVDSSFPFYSIQTSTRNSVDSDVFLNFSEEIQGKSTAFILQEAMRGNELTNSAACHLMSKDKDNDDDNDENKNDDDMDGSARGVQGLAGGNNDEENEKHSKKNNNNKRGRIQIRNIIRKQQNKHTNNKKKHKKDKEAKKHKKNKQYGE